MDRAWPTQQGIHQLGDITLQSGATLHNARLSWKAHGTLAAARDNVIVYPTSYAARHPDLEWLIGPAGILDPGRWFVVICDMFGNGLSSSPSNSPDYPALVTPCDNVVAQRHALHEIFGIERVACVYGWSMGAIQAYHWAALFPNAVERIVVNCGVARTAVHNRVFLRGLMATLEAAPEHTGDGRFLSEPRAALRAFGRIYAGWALSQDFYRAGLHLESGSAGNLGAADLESFSDSRLGTTFRRAACRQSLRSIENLGRRRYQRKYPVRRRSRARLGCYHSERAADAQRDRSLFPCCRQ